MRGNHVHIFKSYNTHLPEEPKYKDKRIELTGIIKGVGQNLSRDTYVRLEAGADQIGVTVHPYKLAQLAWSGFRKLSA